MINHLKMLVVKHDTVRNTVVCFLLAAFTVISVCANPQAKSKSGGIKTNAAIRKKRDKYSGWEMYQRSKSMGMNRLFPLRGWLENYQSVDVSGLLA